MPPLNGLRSCLRDRREAQGWGWLDWRGWPGDPTQNALALECPRVPGFRKIQQLGEEEIEPESSGEDLKRAQHVCLGPGECTALILPVVSLHWAFSPLTAQSWHMKGWNRALCFWMRTTGLFLGASVDLPVQGTFSATSVVAEKRQAIQHCELMNQQAAVLLLLTPHLKQFLSGVYFTSLTCMAFFKGRECFEVEPVKIFENKTFHVHWHQLLWCWLLSIVWQSPTPANVTHRSNRSWNASRVLSHSFFTVYYLQLIVFNCKKWLFCTRMQSLSNNSNTWEHLNTHTCADMHISLYCQTTERQALKAPETLERCLKVAPCFIARISAYFTKSPYPLSQSEIQSWNSQWKHLYPTLRKQQEKISMCFLLYNSGIYRKVISIA